MRNNVFPLAVGAVLLVIIMVLETAGVAASTVWRAFCCCFTWRVRACANAWQLRLSRTSWAACVKGVSPHGEQDASIYWR